MTDKNDPKPTKKTSAVPLRKETVRVTLKSTSVGNASAAGAPPAPAPTIALKTTASGAPATPAPPAPAPTMKLQTGTPTKAPEPAGTVPLQSGTATKTPEPAPTIKLGTPGTTTPTGASSQPLPKATVQLQQSQPMGVPGVSATQAPTMLTAEADDANARKAEGSATALSIIAMVAALIVLGVQLATANIWVSDETQSNPGWGKLFE